MNPRIVFLDEYTMKGYDLSEISKLGEYTGYGSTSEDEIRERCRHADIVITNRVPLRAHAIESLPELRLICIAATGMNVVDLEAAAKAGVKVMNVVGYSTDSVAELTFAGVLALYKQILYYDNYVKSGGYSASGSPSDPPDFGPPTYELRGKKWGIVGLGNIGRKVAGIATAFDCDVSYYSTSGKNTSDIYKRVTLGELLEESDIISVHAPLNQDTHHLLGYEEFSLMKKNSIVVNMARGSIINEGDLARAIDDGLIAGAATDVYGVEPMEPHNPLMSVKDKYRLVLTPHNAWSTREAIRSLVEKIAGNIRSFLEENK